MTTTQASKGSSETMQFDQRIYNFSAGPATIPEPVLEQLREDIWNVRKTGVGVLEHSHRGSTVDDIFDETHDLCRKLAGVGDDFEILFLAGGATLQFAKIPLNFLPEGANADYLITGLWSRQASDEASLVGNVHVAYNGKDENFVRVPAKDDINFSDNPAYVHYCTNNTIYGNRFEDIPETDAPVIADMSSEIFSRPWDYSRQVLTYACAQKNLGPAGATVLIINKDFLAQANKKLPKILSYAENIKKGSRLNTPPVFPIYAMGLVFQWILDEGGVEVMNQRNIEKAKILYDAIDGSGGFYIGHSDKDCRSDMNVSFRTQSPDLDAKFLSEADAHGMSALKGHRSTGGMRASIYNAFPRSGCETLADFMRTFQKENG